MPTDPIRATTIACATCGERETYARRQGARGPRPSKCSRCSGVLTGWVAIKVAHQPPLGTYDLSVSGQVTTADGAPPRPATIDDVG